MLPHACPRRRYRVVLEDVGERLQLCLGYAALFGALDGALSGIGALHAAGLLHGDVGAHSILRVRRAGSAGHMGVVVDVDCAAADMRAGTMPFMAVEVMFRQYHIASVTRELLSAPAPPFRSHVFHDVEAVWWICLWFLCCYAPAASTIRRGLDHPLDALHRVLGTVLPPSMHPALTVELFEWQMAIKERKGAVYRRCVDMDGRVIAGESPALVEDGRLVLQRMIQAVGEHSDLQRAVASVHPKKLGNEDSV
ncbi:hypothetical protein BV25DRAFT_1996235 [Artomyces pyxidatus]|uniref:Uncharacterized protein n=1 Tax=Artomyces pyxidatus TaxID=48021 RepID=A0ACB8SFH0_9AGAM|nr:hypothetical protein BV25DRAFT_1996235 [Artomyces pyxidatus]